MRISAEARSTALLAAFWGLARSLIESGQLDPKTLLGHMAAAKASALETGETEVAVAIDSIMQPLATTYLQDDGGK